jgi:SAM-dependent methyltransferase
VPHGNFVRISRAVPVYCSPWNTRWNVHPSELSTDFVRRVYNEAELKTTPTDQFPEILANTFREHADRFAHIMGLIHAWEPEAILDVGCQKGFTGRLVQWKRGYAPKIIDGVDIAPFSCAYAKDVNGYTGVHCLDFRFPFDLGRKYDLVLCLEVLEHIFDPVPVFENVLKHFCKRALFSAPVEDEPIDGVIHVRHVDAHECMKALIQAFPYMNVSTWFLEARFMEKPHWHGWNFFLVEA